VVLEESGGVEVMGRRRWRSRKVPGGPEVGVDGYPEHARGSRQRAIWLGVVGWGNRRPAPR